MVRGGKGMGIDDVRIGNSEGAALPKVARILIADDHALVREGLRTMLSGEDGIEVIAEANDGQQALNTKMPKTSVMMVTMHENSDYPFEAVKAGAAGYVLKDASGERLLGAVRRTLEGESPLNQELAMRLLVRLARERERLREDQASYPGRQTRRHKEKGSSPWHPILKRSGQGQRDLRQADPDSQEAQSR
jgi:DNA-binding NarL/FixJ family response regulator